MLDDVSSKVDFPALEEEILARWESESIFQRSVEQRRGAREYVFYDGPPFATGLPHYGHLLAGTIKDIVPRYHAMRGHYVERRFGWDCHGLPIEALAQDALGLVGTVAIRQAGIDVFNEQCRSMVLKYVEDWRRTVTRMGRWVDFDNDYKTMDVPFMETIWWVFKQLWERGRVYRAYRIMPYSWKLTTPLSNFEAGNHYKDVEDPAITVRMRVVEGGSINAPTYAVAWTTTPWTLPENLALCVGPDLEYVAAREVSSGDVYLLARSQLATYFPQADQVDVVQTFRGQDLVGWRYEPLFPYYGEHPGAFRIVADPFVTTDEGTGIVHLAPAYGEDDYRVCRREGIDLVDPLDAECRFTDAIPDFAGMFCKDADKPIIRWLKGADKLVGQGVYRHSYPFCERTDTPLIYRAIDAWYVRVEDLRERMVEHNQHVHWVPAYVGRRRFDHWLRDAKDWNISRNRFWGSCIPVWINVDDPNDMVCVGSIAELEEWSGRAVTDLHKHFVDDIEIRRDGKIYRRTPEVLDCWFESGSMPYAQNHYPFENREHFEAHFPADFIAEGLDQTRGWFYTLMVLSTALFDRPPFRNVVVNGMVLAEDGRKMSKRLQNYPDPMRLVNTYGADAIRLTLIASPAVRAEDLCFSEEAVKHALRHLLLPWWNAYSFFVMYARIDGWTPDPAATRSLNLLDRWILSSLETLNGRVVRAMDVYDLQRAVQPFIHFIEDLTNWYIRRSRRRFWKSTDDEDKRQAYATLYQVLLRLCQIAAPYVPFVSDAIYRNLRTPDLPESVHLCDFPQPDTSGREPELEAQMRDVITVVGLGRALRTEHKIKIRQPLQSIHIACRNAGRLTRIQALQDVILDELNVNQVEFRTDEADWVSYAAKADFRRLGPRLGKKVQAVAGAIRQLPADQCEAVLSGRRLQLDVEGELLEIDPEDVEVNRLPREGLAVGAEGDLVVALEIELTPELIREGLAREFNSKVQNMRKAADLEVTQRIRIAFSSDEDVADAVDAHHDYILHETLAVGCERRDRADNAGQEWDLNGHVARILIEKV